MGKESKTVTQIPVVKRTLFSWIFATGFTTQFLIVVLVAITVGARVLPLEMQKRIVNEAIRLNDLHKLYIYCGLYLGAVILASGLKFVISSLQAVLSQKTLAIMRQDLYHHLITLPISFFRRTQPGMVVASLVTELAAAGNFVGMAIATPLINVLTLVAFAVYLFFLNWLLAAISLSIYPAVVFLIPLLQKKVNKYNQQRVTVTRTMADRITDTISGIHEVHGHASFTIENRKFDQIVDKLRSIRVIWNVWSQLVKVTNNFFTNLGPFLVFLLGGYLAMKGRLELGSLVAFLSAQEKLYDPWRELIQFYQDYQTASVQYTRTMEYFDEEPQHALVPKDRPAYELEGSVNIKDLSFVTEDGIKLIEKINLDLKPGEHLALVGFSGSGKSTLAQCVGQLYKYTGGSVQLGGQEVSDISKLDIVNTIGYVAQSPFIFVGTMEDNLFYSVDALNEQLPDDLKRPRPSLDEIISVLQHTGVFVDVLRFGMNTILDRNQDKELVGRLIGIRNDFQRTHGEELADYVEFFEDDRFMRHSTMAENLTFGTPYNDAYTTENLPNNQYFLKFLDEADLTRPLLSLGAELAKQTVDIVGNLPPDRVFFEQSPIPPEELDVYKEIVEKLKKERLHQIHEKHRQRLLQLALRFVPARHKMVGLPGLLENLILEGRALFREKITKDDPKAISFFRRSEYMYSQTILNNILFGNTKTAKQDAQDRINQSIIQLLIEDDFLEAIIEIGLQFQVGSKGDNLSGGQRQKLAIARTFLKAPRVLIMDEATSALDNRSQARIQNQLDTRWKGKSTLIAVVHRLDITKNYDKIAVMKAGKIIEMGKYDELIAKKGMLYELATGKK